MQADAILALACPEEQLRSLANEFVIFFGFLANQFGRAFVAQLLDPALGFKVEALNGPLGQVHQLQIAGIPFPAAAVPDEPAFPLWAIADVLPKEPDQAPRIPC